jgi:hypothetical protein
MEGTAATGSPDFSEEATLNENLVRIAKVTARSKTRELLDFFTRRDIVCLRSGRASAPFNAV